MEFSFGLQRAEVVGALINGIALISLYFTLIVLSLQRFFEPKPIQTPSLILYVGIGGLCISLIGVFLFHNHGHSNHGHSRADSVANSTDALKVDFTASQVDIENPVQFEERVIRVASLMHDRRGSIEDTPVQPSSASSTRQTSHEHEHSLENGKHDPHHPHSKSDNPWHSNETFDHGEHSRAHGSGGHTHHHQDLNMHGVFIHILSDLLVILGVILSALVIILSTHLIKVRSFSLLKNILRNQEQLPYTN